MILEKNIINVEKSGNFESTEFRIDGKYKNKVLWMLINQYRFKIRTPVQEIVSNARDAQRENGNPDTPIKIQLPTKIEPTFIVRDYGVGMDETRIKTIFTSFGASTKNADNSQTGGFGIGAKSPLAYTDSFNIKTYVNGRYWFYVIAKTEDEGIGINLLDTGLTDEENGTEVQIPVVSNDVRDFTKAACRCTMFWEVQPIFNLDDEDLYQVKEGTKIADNLTIYNDDDLGDLFDSKAMILVDGIPYELDHKTIREDKSLTLIDNMLNRCTHCVIELNTGDIDLLQTRESIDETEKTKAQLLQIAADSHFKLEHHIKSSFTDKTLEGRLEQYRDVSRKFRAIKAHQFETFKINNATFRLDKNLNTLEYSYRSKARTAYRSDTVNTIQKHYNDLDYLHTELGIFYYDDLKEESDTIKARRMRNHLTETGEKVILVKQNKASNLTYMRTLRLLRAKKLSTLEKPSKKTTVRGAKKVVVVDHIDVHVLSGSYYSGISRWSKNVSLKNNSIKYVYVAYSDHSFNEYMDDFKWLKLLKGEYKVEPCRISMVGIKAIKNDSNFIHIEKFMETFKPTNKMLDVVISADYSLKNGALAKVIVASNKKIFDKILTKMAHYVTIKKEENNVVLPRKLQSQLIEENKNLINNRSRLLQKFDERIEEKYPLLYSNNSRKNNINYINSKRR